MNHIFYEDFKVIYKCLKKNQKTHLCILRYGNYFIFFFLLFLLLKSFLKVRDLFLCEGFLILGGERDINFFYSFKVEFFKN